MEIQDATEATRGSEFGVFANAPCVRYLIVPKTFSRSEHDRLVVLTKEWGAKGLANLSQVAKFLSAPQLEAFGVPEGSSALCVADTAEVAARVLGLLRLHLARELDRSRTPTSSTGSSTSRSSSATRSRVPPWTVAEMPAAPVGEEAPPRRPSARSSRTARYTVDPLASAPPARRFGRRGADAGVLEVPAVPRGERRLPGAAGA